MKEAFSKISCDYCRVKIRDEHDHFRYGELDICQSCHMGCIE